MPLGPIILKLGYTLGAAAWGGFLGTTQNHGFSTEHNNNELTHSHPLASSSPISVKRLT